VIAVGINWQLARDRPGCGVAERSVVPMKPGNSGGGKGPQLKTDARSNEGHGGLTHKSSHPQVVFRSCRRPVTRNSVSLFREPDAVTPPVRFDEREQETQPSQTGLRRRSESPAHQPPEGYSHCACSRLYSRGCEKVTAITDEWATKAW